MPFPASLDCGLLRAEPPSLATPVPAARNFDVMPVSDNSGTVVVALSAGRMGASAALMEDISDLGAMLANGNTNIDTSSLDSL